MSGSLTSYDKTLAASASMFIVVVGLLIYGRSPWWVNRGRFDNSHFPVWRERKHCEVVIASFRDVPPHVAVLAPPEALQNKTPS